MENMNEKSEKKHSHRQKSPNDFAKTVVIFVCVELIIVVGAIIGVNKNACNAVHKLEAAMPKSVMDLQINPNQDTYVSLDTIMEQMKAAEGVTEELKRTSQMEWVQRCNNIHNRAEEIILHEMVYS